MYKICPDCSSEYININSASDFTHIHTENNEIVYSCADCDWYEVKEKPFYVGAWSIEIRQALAPIDMLESLLNDKDIVGFLKPRIKGHSHLRNLKLPPSGLELSDEYLRGEINIAYKVYLRQMVVIAASYIELILKDFFTSLYTSKPRSMNQVLQPYGEKRAYVSLNEILESESKKELVQHLVDRAARRKVSNDLDKILKQLISDCGLELDRPFVEDVCSLKEKRNRIVHEETDEEISVDQVYDYFRLIQYLLYVLAKVSEQKKVPCLDDTGFLRDFEDRLHDNGKNEDKK